MPHFPCDIIDLWVYQGAVMRIFSGAIALGLLMGLPVGVLVVESTSAQEELTQAPQNENQDYENTIGGYAIVRF